MRRKEYEHNIYNSCKSRKFNRSGTVSDYHGTFHRTDLCIYRIRQCQTSDHANGGLIHLQRSTFHLRDLFGKKSGALAGGIGMGLFDLLSGWTAWAPFTFVIVAIMGYVVGAITEKHHGLGFDALAIVAACVIKVVGYYIAEGIIYGNWIAPFTSIPGNLVQIGVAAVVVLIVIEPLRKAANKNHF